MTNLFSIFDPSTSSMFSMNWLSMVFPVLLAPYLYWAFPSRIQMVFFMLSNYIISELKNNLTKENFKTLLIFFTLFWFVMCNNLMGLYPYIFTATSHLVITLTLALPFWILFMLYGWINLTNHMFTHLVPLGTPMALSFFMVFIETISNVIRPITLSVRLAANMIAGHLLLSLLSGISEAMPIIFIPSSIVLATLLTLEYAVAIIQSYVFITLMSLYLNEIN
uniref:ATP synthase F0 subunit 6 n=1 Tax=Parasitus fimetorum TaxID=2022322 RepID=UPI001FAF2D57|nr:ATP synthase F0 subunit 6 [Parasitus fimetorum]UKO33173.1 ATP synthase subunit 6 [Parasitus fimetorum]